MSNMNQEKEEFDFAVDFGVNENSKGDAAEEVAREENGCDILW